MIHWALGAILFTITTSATADVRQILDGLDRADGAAIPFVERRGSALLSEPLLLRGELSVDADGVLTKVIHEPVRESVRMTAERVELSRDGRARRINLRRRDDLRAFYAGMIALLNGDADALLRVFDVTTQNSNGQWTIKLVPNDDRLTRLVDALIVTGSGNRVATVRTSQPGGDWQELSFDRTR